MKVTISYDELWPRFLIEDEPDYGKTVEVSLETVERWRQAAKDFSRAQREMEQLHGPIN